MFRYHLALACLLVAGTAQIVSAQQPFLKDLPVTQVKEPSIADAQALAAKIDQLLDRRMADAKVVPAPLANDSEFLRRVYLDLAGRIPSVAETRAFLNDKQPDRRGRVIDRLLNGPRYVNHFAVIYRTLLIPGANSNFFVRIQQDGLEKWVKKQLSENAGYDRIARDLLSGSVGSGDDFGELFGGEASTSAFFAAKEYKPENLAASAARVFLGVRIECAQCHKHPFADWNREQFWSMAAFFAGVQGKRQGDILVADKENPYKRDIVMPGASEKVVQARFLDGSKPNWETGATTRATFAEWVTSPNNAFFARTAVNRTWAYFFGTGLVEPIDEMIGADIPNPHPELLDLLAREFAEKQFNLKYLFRAITLTQAYQRTSAFPKGETTKPDPTLFTRMPLKGMSPEQLFDSLATATGFRDTGESSPLGEVLGIGKASPRSQFVTKFTNLSDRATMAQTSILQALTLMNGKVTADATSLERSETLAALLDAPFLSTADRVETLYLAAFSRRPSGKELDRAVRFIGERNANGYAEAVADVFWALLNSSEFVLNH